MKLSIIIALTTTSVSAQVTAGCASAFDLIGTETAFADCECDDTCTICKGAAAGKMVADQCFNTHCAADHTFAATDANVNVNLGTCTANAAAPPPANNAEPAKVKPDGDACDYVANKNK